MLLPLPTCIDNQLQESRHFGFVWLHATATSLNRIPPETKLPIFFQIIYSFDVFTKLRGQAPARTDAHTWGRQLKPFGFQVLADPRSRRSASLSLARTAACEFGEKNLCKETVQATLLRKNDVVNYDRLLFSFLWIQPGPLLMLSAVL